MSEPLSEGLPMFVGKDFTVGDRFPAPVMDSPGEWSVFHATEDIDSGKIEIGTPIGLNTYDGEPTPLAKVIRITPHDNGWGTGYLVTIDAEKPWKHWYFGPWFYEWAVL